MGKMHLLSNKLGIDSDGCAVPHSNTMAYTAHRQSLAANYGCTDDLSVGILPNPKHLLLLDTLYLR